MGPTFPCIHELSTLFGLEEVINDLLDVAQKVWLCQWVPVPLGTTAQEEPHNPDQQMGKQAAFVHLGHTVVSL